MREPAQDHISCACRLTGSVCEFIEKNGAPGRIRTRDPLITNQVLYQLSYKGSGDADSSNRIRKQEGKARLACRVWRHYRSAPFVKILAHVDRGEAHLVAEIISVVRHDPEGLGLHDGRNGVCIGLDGDHARL
jgi:hypothetical protein